MRRRRFMATAASGVTLPAAGCLGFVREPTSLGAPAEELDHDGLEKHLVYTRDGEKQAVITINQRRRPSSLDQPVPFRLHVWHREGLSIDRLFYKLRAPPHSTGVPAEISLKIPSGGPWPPFKLRQEDNLWTVIAVEDLGWLGEGSLTLDLLIEPISEPADQLGVQATVDFSDDGLLERRYRASATTEFDLLTSEN